MPLSKLDRCDSCNAEALVRTTKGTQDLLFCGHHWVKNQAALDLSGWTVDCDERDRINKKPSPSANAD